MCGNYLLLCLFIGILICFVGATEAIVNGKIVQTLDQFPYYVSLLISGDVVCGGGIIGDEFVLTAAHCAFGQDGQLRETRIYILANTLDRKEKDPPALVAHATHLYVPIEYDAKKFRSPDVDIAVIKCPQLAPWLGLSKNHHHSRKLNLPRSENLNYIGKTAVIAGFGWDWYNTELGTGGQSSTRLRYAEADVVEICDAMYLPEVKKIVEGSMCVQVKQYDLFKPAGVCHVDSGGPLVHDGTVIGVLSLCIRTCNEMHAGSFYTPVVNHLKFIHRAMDYERNKYHWDIQEYHLH